LTVHHVSGKNNEVADVLSQHHTDNKKIFDHKKYDKMFICKQSLELLGQLRMPTNKIFIKEEVAHMLEADSLPSPDEKPKKKSPAKTGVRKVNKTCLGRFQDCGRGKGKNM
jgi:hypothetical protein